MSTAVHRGITCDECGMSPIVGVRYKARFLYDYDVCAQCFQSHTKQGEFVPFGHPVPHRVSRLYGPQVDQGLQASSVLQAAERIRSNQSKHYAYLHNLDTNSEQSRQLRQALASDCHLDLLHIHSCHTFTTLTVTATTATVRRTEAAAAAELQPEFDIARGLRDNKSIRRLIWHISSQKCTQEFAEVLRDMIQGNDTLETIFILRSCGLHLQNKSDEATDAFALTVLQGLDGNRSIRNVRLSLRHPVSHTLKEPVMKIIQRNPNLERVWVEFKDDGIVMDPRVEMLLACNRGQWIPRLRAVQNDPNAALGILVQAIHDAGTSVDPVITASHLLCRFPGVILPRTGNPTL